MSPFFAIFLYSLAVLAFAGFSLIAPHLVGPRKSTAVKDMPYESGMDPIGDARKPLDIKFYLIAILFVVFDVELLYIFPWAVALRSEPGFGSAERWGILAALGSLLGTLVLAYVYAWRKGVFRWRSK